MKVEFLPSMSLSRAGGVDCLIGSATKGSTLLLRRRRSNTASPSRPVTWRISSQRACRCSIRSTGRRGHGRCGWLHLAGAKAPSMARVTAELQIALAPCLDARESAQGAAAVPPRPSLEALEALDLRHCLRYGIELDARIDRRPLPRALCLLRRRVR